MANELALPDYSIEMQLPEITIKNFEALTKAVLAYADKYNNLAVTTDTEKEAKASRAELRKLKAALDDKRKEIRKKYAEPYQQFADKINKLQTYLDGSINPIDKGLKELDQQQRETRKTHVDALIAEMAPSYGVEINRVSIDPKWLNKSTAKKAVTQGIADEMKSIKARDDQMRKDVTAITKYAESKNVDPAGWVSQVQQGQDIDYLFSAIDNAVTQKAKKQQELKAQVAAEKTQQATKGKQTVDKSTGEIVSHSVALKITATIPQMNLLKSFMDSNGIKYERAN